MNASPGEPPVERTGLAARAVAVGGAEFAKTRHAIESSPIVEPYRVGRRSLALQRTAYAR